jgi:hypothetical protein
MDAETTAHGSTDANHAHAHAGSSVVQIRIESRGALIGILVGAGVLVLLVAACIGVAIYNSIQSANLATQYQNWAQQDHHLAQQKWLHDSDLSDFQRGPFNDLQREVEVSQKLFQTCKR